MRQLSLLVPLALLGCTDPAGPDRGLRGGAQSLDGAVAEPDQSLTADPGAASGGPAPQGSPTPSDPVAGGGGDGGGDGGDDDGENGTGEVTGGDEAEEPQPYWPPGLTSTVCADGSAEFLDIQDAIDVADYGAVIGVCPGTYGPIQVRWLQSVTVLGIEGPDVTAIDGAGTPAVYVHEGTLIMRGFRLTGQGYVEEWDPDAGCVTVYEGDGVFTDCVVADCTGPFALLFDEDTLEMHGVRWENNRTDYLWYLWQGEDDDGPVGWATFTHNTVVGGVHETLVETTKLVDLTITNSLFADLTIDRGFTAFRLTPFEDGPLLVANNVFYDIDDLDPWGGRLFEGEADFRNNVVMGCDSRDLVPMEASYSLFWDNGVDYAPYVEGEGNLFVDPGFTDPAALDFTLQPGSPAIDAGDPDPAFDDADGSRNDIGIYGGPN